MSALKNVIERKGRPYAPQLNLSARCWRDSTAPVCQDTGEFRYGRSMELSLTAESVCTDDEYTGVRIIMARTLLRALYSGVHAALGEIETAVACGDRRGALRLIAELQEEIDDVEDLPNETETMK